MTPICSRCSVLILAILSLAACQSPSAAGTPQPLYWLAWSGPTLDTGYLAAAEEAASDWNTALGRPVFAFGWRPFVSVDLVQVPYRIETSDRILAIGRTDRSHWPTPIVAVSTDTDPSEYRVTVEHELGHILGLSHSSDPDDLMYPAPRLDARVSPEDKRRALGILGL